MELSPTTTAGLANFAGGAAASLSTQLVTVPIDVISQRQIVHGTQGQQQQQHAAAAAQSSAAPRPQAAAPAAAARPHASTPAPAAAAAAVQAQQGGVRSYHTRRAVGGATMWPAQQHLHHLQRCGAVREGPAPWLRHVVGAGCHGGPRLSTAAAGGAAAASQRISGLAMMRIILKEEGVAGLYRYGPVPASSDEGSARSIGACERGSWRVFVRRPSKREPLRRLGRFATLAAGALACRSPPSCRPPPSGGPRTASIRNSSRPPTCSSGRATPRLHRSSSSSSTARQRRQARLLRSGRRGGGPGRPSSSRPRRRRRRRRRRRQRQRRRGRRRRCRAARWWGCRWRRRCWRGLRRRC